MRRVIVFKDGVFHDVVSMNDIFDARSFAMGMAWAGSYFGNAIDAYAYPEDEQQMRDCELEAQVSRALARVRA